MEYKRMNTYELLNNKSNVDAEEDAIDLCEYPSDDPIQ